MIKEPRSQKDPKQIHNSDSGRTAVLSATKLQKHLPSRSVSLQPRACLDLALSGESVALSVDSATGKVVPWHRNCSGI